MAVDGRVVHGTKHNVAFLGLNLGSFTIEARGGGHIEAAFGRYEAVGVYFGETAFVLFLIFYACGAVGFVANDEVHLMTKGINGFFHYINALIG